MFLSVKKEEGAFRDGIGPTEEMFGLAFCKRGRGVAPLISHHLSDGGEKNEWQPEAPRLSGEMDPPDPLKLAHAASQHITFSLQCKH